MKDLFTGQRWISELGLYDDRNRFMSPDLGRFLQPDPIGFKGDASNLYRYCGNDWANRTDPMGLTEAQPIPKPDLPEQLKEKAKIGGDRDRGSAEYAMLNVQRINFRSQQDLMMGFTMQGGMQKGSAYRDYEKIPTAPAKNPGPLAPDGKHHLIATDARQLEALKAGLQIVPEHTGGGQEEAVGITTDGKGNFGITQNYALGRRGASGYGEVGLPKLTRQDYPYFAGKVHGHDQGRPWDGSDFRWSNHNQLPSAINNGHGNIYIPYYNARDVNGQEGIMVNVF